MTKKYHTRSCIGQVGRPQKFRSLSNASKDLGGIHGRKYGNIRHCRRMVNIKFRTNQKFGKKMVNKMVKKEINQQLYNNDDKQFTNTSFCSDVIRGGKCIVLDGPTFNTGNMLMSYGIDANDICIPACDCYDKKKSYNECEYFSKCKANISGFHIIHGRMEETKTICKILAIIGDGFIGGIYFDAMGSTTTAPAANIIMSKLYNKLANNAPVSVTYASRNAPGDVLLNNLIKSLHKISPNIRLDLHYPYGNPRGDKQMNMVYTKFIKTTRKIEPTYRIHKIIKITGKYGGKKALVKWRGFDSTNNTWITWSHVLLD
jgi:hypothetical protein